MASGGHSSSQCAGLSLSQPLLSRSTGSRRIGSELWLTGPAALRHVGSSQTRARTCVPCIGRQILNHCATRGALRFYFILHTHVSILLQILFPFGLLQNIEQRSLCYTVGPCWLSVLNIAVCTCRSQTPNLSPPPTFPPSNHKFVL